MPRAQYDNANRLTQVEHKPSSAGAAFARFNWTYDKAGNRVTQSDFDGSATTTQQFEYDKTHRLVRETPRAGFAPTAYQYDSAGNRLRTSDGQALTENDNPALLYSGTPNHITDANASGGSYARLGQGQYVDFVFTGDAVSFIYNMNNDEGTVRLTLDPGPSQIVLADIVQTLSGPGTTYQHQKTFTGLAAGAHVLRVTMISGCPSNPGNEHAIVDAVRAYSAGKQHLFDDDNRLKQTTEGANNTIYQYDKNGSLTKKTLGTDNTLYAYDGARRLKDVSFNGTSQASFTYL